MERDRNGERKEREIERGGSETLCNLLAGEQTVMRHTERDRGERKRL